jgi:type II secretory pathway pseudopilin PulG
MFPHHYRFTAAHGFSRIEFLVLAIILVILAGVACNPIAGRMEKAKISRATESAHTISTLLSQYATDNNGVYPVGLGTPAAGKSEGIARNLLENTYTNDAAIFAIGSAPRYAGKASDFSDITAANVSWDFTGGATVSSGVTSTAPDSLPMVYSTGETVTYPASVPTGLDLPLSGNGPFAKKGIVVAYKNNSAAFIPGTPSGAAVECRGFIPAAFKSDTAYTQIKP